MHRDEYATERALFDAWAEWVDSNNRADILKHWYPRQDCTSRLADRYGKRSGTDGRELTSAPVEYLSTPEEREGAFARLTKRQSDAKSEQVDAFMAALKTTDPKQHLCLEARHRRVIGSISVGLRRDRNGRMRPMRDSDLAMVCIGGAMTDESKRMVFRRYCVEAYRKLRELLAR